MTPIVVIASDLPGCTLRIRSCECVSVISASPWQRQTCCVAANWRV